MTWFGKRGELEKGSAPFEPVSPGDSDDALRVRINGLVGDEFEIYKWLREYYSERWIAETLLLGRRAAKQTLRRVYRKLGVKNKKALLEAYGRFQRPRTGQVDTDEIDTYLDARREAEIQKRLKSDSENAREDKEDGE